MKKHAKRPDGYKFSKNYAFYTKRKMRWLWTLKPGDAITTCRGTVEVIETIDVETDELKTTKGFYCSPYHCIDPAELRTCLSMRRWVKKYPDRFNQMLRDRDAKLD